MNSFKNICLVIVGIIVTLLFSAVYPKQAANVQGVYSQSLQYFYYGASIGDDSKVAPTLSQDHGLCLPSFSSADMAASSSATGICFDTSIVAGDNIQVTSSGVPIGMLGNGFVSLRATATTSGQFGVLITNSSGGATTSINSVYRAVNWQSER